MEDGLLTKMGDVQPFCSMWVESGASRRRRVRHGLKVELLAAARLDMGWKWTTIAGPFFGMACLEGAVVAHHEWARVSGAVRVRGMGFPPCLGERERGGRRAEHRTVYAQWRRCPGVWQKQAWGTP